MKLISKLCGAPGRASQGGDRGPWRPPYCLLFFWLFAAVVQGHDIPSDVTVNLHVKPANQRMQVLVRLPLRAIRDINFPERERGYLDIEKTTPLLADAATVNVGDFLRIEENGVRLPQPRVVATQISLASDHSFTSFKTALARVVAPKMANYENVVWNQVWLDMLLEVPIRSDRSAFSIQPHLEHLAARVLTVLRFLPPDGGVRGFELHGDQGMIPLDPQWGQAAWRFVALGFEHILGGLDHLLFLLCLVIPLRRFGALVGVVTAFTVAHSITLLASAYDFAPGALWFPALIETMIALSIVWMALENIVGSSSFARRWTMAFAFGLVHGFGFSFALRDTLQFAGSHLLTSLVAFNIGVELGQLLVLVLLIPALWALFRWVAPERIGSIILSAIVAHTGWHWLLERATVLTKYKLEWPMLDAAFFASAMRGAMLLMLLGAAAWAGPRILKRFGWG